MSKSMQYKYFHECQQKNICILPVWTNFEASEIDDKRGIFYCSEGSNDVRMGEMTHFLL